MKKKIIAVLTIALSIMAFAACSNTDTIEVTEASSEVAASGETSSIETTETETTTATTTEKTEDISSDEEMTYPIVIKHAFGETVIESKPERVATIAWGNHDTPLSLGVVPVGVSKANYGVLDDSGLLPWTKAAYESLGVSKPVLYDDLAGLNYEQINDSAPDVILAAYSGLTQEEYDLLSAIAPVVAYPTMAWQTLWRDQIIMDATGMGMATKGASLVAELEALIEQKTETYPSIEGKSAAFFYFSPTDLSSFWVYLPADPRAAYLTDLGMVFPESVLALADENSSFALQLSSEHADVLSDIDIIITYGNGELLELMQADALLGTVPAVMNGAVAMIEDGTPLAASGTPSALSIPATIDEFLAIIAQAADNVQ